MRPPPADSAVAAKKALRRRALEQRQTLQDDGAADTAKDHLLAALPPRRGQVISGYVAMRSELSPLPALKAFEAAGCAIALPHTTGKGMPLRFLAAPGGGATSKDAFGISAPPSSAAEIDPDILLVPLAAFDRRGFRLGYGGGFYDAALTRLRATRNIVAVGWAYAEQQVDAVPTEPHDEALDWIVTEREAIYIQR